MEIKKFIKRVIYGIAIGIFGIILYVQNSDRCARTLERELQKLFFTKFSSHFIGNFESIKLVPLSIQFNNIAVYPKNKSEKWSWKAEHIEFSLSWFSFLIHQKFDFWVEGYNVVVHSEYKDGKLSFVEHIKLFFSKVKFPWFIGKQCGSFKNLEFYVEDYDKKMKNYLCIDGKGSAKSSSIQGDFCLIDGCLVKDDQEIVSDIAGSLSFEMITKRDSNTSSCTFNNSFKIAQLPLEKQNFTLQGIWNGSEGSINLSNNDASCTLGPLTLIKHKENYLYKMQGSCPCNLLSYVTPLPKEVETIKGNVEFFLSGINDEYGGTVHGNNLSYLDSSLEKLFCTFYKIKNNIYGTTSLFQNNEECYGHWSFNFDTKDGFFTLNPITEWTIFKDWMLLPGATQCKVVVSEKVPFSLHHTLLFQHKKTDAKIKAQGATTLSMKQELDFQGFWGSKKYFGKVELFPYIKPHFIMCKNNKEKILLNVTGHYPGYNFFDAQISYDFLRELIFEYCDYDIPGEGTFLWSGKVTKKRLSLILDSQDMTLSLPETYNFISGIKATAFIDWDPFSVVIRNLLIKMHKGKIESKELKYEWDNNKKESFWHAPFQLHKCFLNWKKDLFVLNTGAFVFQKRLDKKATLDGFMAIEKGQLKENPFSLTKQKETTQSIFSETLLESMPLDINVHLFTHSPVYIDTPFLKSRATIDLTMQSVNETPILSGALNLHQGMLHFPYKSLSIVKADINFLPHQFSDPLINIVARSTIKKYTITLFVTGSLETPHISLDSIPYLSEEQILSLLFTGAVEETLPGMVPLLIIQNLESLLFGINQKKDAKTSLWKDSLKKIRLIPQFSDQTGRGGMRGTLEIDITDYLHALFQKNFTLSEDTRFEVEYIISDDMSIRAVKDERGDIGGELEMRFKF